MLPKDMKTGALILAFACFGITSLDSNAGEKQFTIDFPVNRADIDTAFANNGPTLNLLSAFIDSVNATATAGGDAASCRIALRGTASPEGNHQHNRRLAERRIAALEGFVRSRLALPGVEWRRDTSFIPWEELLVRVRESDLAQRDRVARIIENEPNVCSEATIAALRAIDGSRTWNVLRRRHFAQLRQALVLFSVKALPRSSIPGAAADTIAVASDSATVDTVNTVNTVNTDTVVADTVPANTVIPLPAAVGRPWDRRLTVKTNAVGLALLVANLGVELDLVPRLSLSVPVYYSAWNYFTYKVKFRTLSVNPELRLWLRRDNTGFFAAAHAALAYYNFATGGGLRRQSHSRNTPAVGGGVNVGCRLPLRGSGHWSVELSVGCGAYRVHSDKYVNRHNGFLTGSERETWWGVDNAAISICYSFNLNRRRP